MPGTKGFAFPAMGDLELAATLSGSAEELGYTSVWTNDTPAADGLAVAVSMLQATGKIRVGVGAVPCDRRPAAGVAAEFQAAGVALDRLTIVVGAGGSAGLETVRAAVGTLRSTLGPDVTVGVAALGPRMCQLGGEIADVVLLNWMNPERIRWARQRIAEGAAQRAAGLGAGPQVCSYIRVAVGQGAGMRVAAEANRYAQMPQYARNFAAMGVASVGIGAPDPATAPAQVVPYEAVLDEAILRCIVTIPTGDDLESVFEALSVMMEVQSLFAPTPLPEVTVSGAGAEDGEGSEDQA